jgi:hypothetical protein
MLSGNLTEEQKKSLQQILTMAEQKRNQKRSDAIEKSGGEFRVENGIFEGWKDLINVMVDLIFHNLKFLNFFLSFSGFQFTQQAIPTNFNFSSPPSN